MSEALCGLGQSVGYYPKVAVRIGGVKEAILLCQFVYWTNEAQDSFSKTAAEITNFTGLSEGEQTTARRKLRDLGIITEDYARIDHQLFFTVNLEKMDEIFNAKGPVSPTQGLRVREPEDERLAGATTKGSHIERISKEEETAEAALPEQEPVEVAFWNSQPRLPKILRWQGPRFTKLKRRRKDTFFACNWKAAIERTNASDFCTGNGQTGWKASFDWFLQPDAAVKIMEGKYDNNKPAAFRPEANQIQEHIEVRTIDLNAYGKNI